MTDTELQAMLRTFARRRPFSAYLLEFNSGVQVLVDHPEGVCFFNSFWLYRGPKKAQALFTSSSVCRLADVT